VTRLYEEGARELDYPNRKALRNFTWTDEAISAWEEIWHELWRLGYKWEWQNTDRYARRRGDAFNLFIVHNDAVRLDMAIPLPGLDVIASTREAICDNPARDMRLDRLVGAIDVWLKKFRLS
jgi:hypothetical protein